MTHQKTPQRVLQYTYGGSHVSGIDTYLLETYRAIDRARTQFDFLFRYKVPYPAAQNTELSVLGAKVNALGVDESRNVLVKQISEAKRLWGFFKKNRYVIVEINMTSTFMCLQAAIIARIFGAKVLIIHAHDAATSESRVKGALKRLATPFLRIAATDYWACAPEAALYLFGKKVSRQGNWTLIRNSVDVSRFTFDSAIRQSLRSTLELENKFVVGMVGRLVDQKNHAFGLEIFSKAAKLRNDLILVIVGDGPLLPQIQKQIAALQLEERVFLLGSRDDVPDLLNAFDALLAPSRHEGFPIIAIEGQASGLPLLASTAFPKTSEILPQRLIRLSLADPAHEWAQTLISLESNHRSLYAEQVKASGYDRATTSAKLAALYSDLALRTKQ